MAQVLADRKAARWPCVVPRAVTADPLTVADQVQLPAAAGAGGATDDHPDPIEVDLRPCATDICRLAEQLCRFAFDERWEVSSPLYPGERLIVCATALVADT